MKRINLLLLLLFLSFFVSGCSKTEPVKQTESLPVKVKVQFVADSKQIRQELEYPAIVSASTEAKLIAKVSGSLSEVNFQVGDEVKIGQKLAHINEIGSSNFTTDGFNSNQIKQAMIAVEQAQSAYQLARSNYENLLVSSSKDLRQAEIARDQAKNAQSNLNKTFEESLKSAELAYETAKIATEQARLALLNRQKQMEQASLDADQNANLAANIAFNTAGSIITGINNLTAFDNNNVVSIPYRYNLGALDSNSYNQAYNNYQTAKSAYDTYSKANFSDTSQRLEAALDLLDKVKKLADSTKYLFDKSVPSSSLPQSSSVGVSLASLQSTAASYQSQLNNVISQVQGADQALTNVILNNDSTLDALKQAYELARKQEDSAKQSLNNLKAGNSSQNDQAEFSINLAQNQYENLKVKLNSQILAAKTQMDTAQLQYNNALVALQNLYDVYSLVSPINGVVTQKMANNGDTISAGQLIAVVSQIDNLKVKFFVDPEYILDIKLGDPVEVISNDSQKYQGLISSVAAQADNITKRFQVEVKLDDKAQLLLGTVVTVKLSLEKNITIENNEVVVPLSSLEIGQNGSFIFLFDNGKARKIPVELRKILGEKAQIKLEASSDVMLIIDGNKLLHDGDIVEIES